MAAALTLGAWLGAAQALAQGAPKAELEVAENAYVYGDFAQVIERITPLVEPNLRLATPADQSRAWELLGLSHFFLRAEPQARRAFTQLLYLDPDRRLDPLVVPPQAIALFESIRVELADELAAEREAMVRRRQAEEERRRRENLVEVHRDIRRNSRLVAVMPLGIGQFQNGDHGMAALFLTSELLAIGTSIAAFLAVEDLRQPSGRFAQADLPRAESLQTVQVASGAAALGLMALGAAHALFTFREDRVTHEREVRPGHTPAVAPAPGGAVLSLSLEW